MNRWSYFAVLMLVACGGGGGGGGSPSASGSPLGPGDAFAQTITTTQITNSPLDIRIIDPRTIVGLRPTCVTDQSGTLSPTVAYTVPLGMTFILTDIMGNGTVSDERGEVFSSPTPHPLAAGYPFAPGTTLRVSRGCLTMAGYLVKN